MAPKEQETVSREEAGGQEPGAAAGVPACLPAFLSAWLAMHVYASPAGGVDCFSSPPADEPRTILVYNGTLRVQTLPVVLFSGGHVAFVQRTPWK